MPELKQFPDEACQELTRIEKSVKQARAAGAGPKTAETLDLMQRAIEDTRAHFKKTRMQSPPEGK